MKRIIKTIVLLFSLSILFAVTLSTTASADYYEKVQAFINNDQWKHGTGWYYWQTPKTEPNAQYYGCAAYAFDFARMVWGTYSYQQGVDFWPTNNDAQAAIEIQDGDVVLLYRWNSKEGAWDTHFYVVLDVRDDGTYLTAEGNTWVGKDEHGHDIYTVYITDTKYSKSNIHPYYDMIYMGWHNPNYEPYASHGFLDVNGYFDGELTYVQDGWVTFDLYLNDSLAENDISDYCMDLPAGTRYQIRDIKPAAGKSFDGFSNYIREGYSVSGGSSGTISANTDVRLAMHTIDAKKYSGSEESFESSIFNGHKYIYFNVPSTWYEAKMIAEECGGHLVTIESEAENNFSKSLIGETVWLGATDRDSEGNWKWLTGEALTYSDWNLNQPDNASLLEGQEDFLEIREGKWNDIAGCTMNPFICEIDSVLLAPDDVTASVNGFSVDLSWGESPLMDANDARAYEVCVYAAGDLASPLLKTENITVTDLSFTLDAHGEYVVTVTAINTNTGAASAPASRSFFLLDDEWLYTDTLPVGLPDCEIQYMHSYSVQAETSPGEGWTQGEGVTTYSEAGQSQDYYNVNESDTHRLISYYYYHYCGASAGNVANFAPGGNFVHLDQIDPSRVTVYQTVADDDDPSITAYVLQWNDSGEIAFCGSGVTCDGSAGEHGPRSKGWYRMNVYQDYTKKTVYQWTKPDTDWVDSPDSTATSVRYRFRAESCELRFDSKGGSAVESQTVTRGDKALKPEDPTKDGCWFLGWFEDEEMESPFDFETPLTVNITLRAGWAEPEIVLPEDLTTIEDEAFLGIEASYILLPDHLTAISSTAFDPTITLLVRAGTETAALVKDMGWRVVEK